jgi:hypothetical protein
MKIRILKFAGKNGYREVTFMGLGIFYTGDQGS